MNICVIGSGYVGLVTGSCLADSGNNVICLDIDKSKISDLKKGKVGIYEPGLSSVVERNVKSNRLNFTTDYKSAIETSEIIFLAVPTPPNEDGSANLEYIKSAALELSHYMNSYKIIVTKSTVPVGTTNLVKDLISSKTKQEFDVASNPEFLKEGSALNDFMFPDRIVIGVESLKAEKKLKELYEPFMRKEFRLVVVDIKSSELSIRLTSYTPCFRREAGSYGAHVRGLNRLHQFDKVEIVRIEQPENSYSALEEMVDHIKGILDELELPYSILRLCGGDLGFTSCLTYDFEVYSAAQKKWLEVSSVSNFETFQANRLKLRIDNNGTKSLAHTLNGSSLALPRIVACILENFQTENSIKIPQALINYTGFEEI